jgi:hypothetical protein
MHACMHVPAYLPIISSSQLLAGRQAGRQEAEGTSPRPPGRNEVVRSRAVGMSGCRAIPERRERERGTDGMKA